MIIDTICYFCKAVYEIDESCIGEEKTCKCCGNKFMIEVKSDMKIKTICSDKKCRQQHTIEDNLLGTMMNCRRCDREFKVKRYYESSDLRHYNSQGIIGLLLIMVGVVAIIKVIPVSPDGMSEKERYNSAPSSNQWASDYNLYIAKFLSQMNITNASEFEWKDRYGEYEVRYRKYRTDEWNR